MVGEGGTGLLHGGASELRVALGGTPGGMRCISNMPPVLQGETRAFAEGVSGKTKFHLPRARKSGLRSPTLDVS